jgi:hypothetical protein
MNATSERGFQGGRPTGTSSKAASSPSSGTGAQSSEPMQQAAGAIKDQAASAESAKDLASKASDKVVSAVEEQKAAGADFVSGVAGSIRRAAHEFGQVPQAAQYLRLAADQIDSVSGAFRRRDLNQIVSDVQGFARQQPTAFFGAAVLAGFAVVRFLKTSVGATAGSPSERHQASVTGSEVTPGYHPPQRSESNFREAGM